MVVEGQVEREADRGAQDGAGGVRKLSVPLRNAMNEVTRQAYVADCEIGLKRWNRMIQKAGYAIELRLPSTRFRRSIGSWRGYAEFLQPLGQALGVDIRARLADT